MRVTTACLGPLGTHCYLIEVRDKILLVDPAEDSQALHSLIAGRSVDTVVLTHGHFDHVGGAWAVEASEIVMHSADLPFVDEYFPDHGSIDRFVQEGDEILPGIAVMHMPGHSPGSLVLQTEDRLFVGDVLFAGSIGRTDLPAGSMPLMMDSLRRLMALPGDFAVYPGHGESTRLEQERRTNPYLRMVR
jgi:glyoxylase-like metal-dependent hydrolase (beta-lactamase superfamily II)